METAIEGWANIAKMFNTSVRVMMNRKAELESCGAIFYMLKGDPRKHQRRRVVCAFPSQLRNWIRVKASKGERF
jgi:hypothetical protein